MQFRSLGRTGITVPIVGAGCWALGGPAENLGMPMGWSTSTVQHSRDALNAAYDLGIRLFDTADVYGLGRSERLVGELVSAIPRDSIVLSSKVGYFSGTAQHAYAIGNMRHQFEQTLENLQTDFLDIYFFHNNNFGTDDRYLDEAVAWMEELRSSGLVRHVGMRGPHRYALDRGAEASKNSKAERFLYLANRIRPDVLAVRDNLLSPLPRLRNVYSWAKENDCGVLVNKPLSQGLLTGKHGAAPIFGAGDHRLRKAWFRGPQLEVIQGALKELKCSIGVESSDDLVSIAIWSCLVKYESAVALCGFTDVSQVSMNVAAARAPRPSSDVLDLAGEIMGRAQARLDSLGETIASPGSRVLR